MPRLTLFLPAALSLSLSLAACAPSTGTLPDRSVWERVPPESSPKENHMESTCHADTARSFVGRTATADVVEQARIAAHAGIARTLKPGQIVTMEYHAGRLNIDVDANNVILDVRCG